MRPIPGKKPGQAKNETFSLTPEEIRRRRWVGVVVARQESDPANSVYVSQFLAYDGQKRENITPPDHREFLPLWQAPPPAAQEGTFWEFVVAPVLLPTPELSEFDATGNAEEAKPIYRYPIVTTDAEAPRRVLIVEDALTEQPAAPTRPRPIMRSLNAAAPNGPTLEENIEEARHRWTESPRARACPGELLLRFGDKGCVGPLPLIKGDDDRWRVPPGCYPLRAALPADSVFIVQIGSGTYRLLSSENPLPAVISLLDFRPDAALLSEFTDRKETADASLNTSDALHEPYLAFRQKKIAGRLASEKALRHQLRESFAVDPKFLQERDAAIAEAVEKAVADSQDRLRAAETTAQEMEAMLVYKRERLAEIESRLASADAQESALTAERIAEISAQIAGQTAATVAGQIIEKTLALQREAVNSLTAEISAVLTKLTPTPAVPEIRPTSAFIARLRERNDGLEIVTTANETAYELSRQLQWTGSGDEKTAKLLVATWLSGLTPLLIGPEALRLLRVADESVCGGGKLSPLLCATLNPVMGDVSEIFGRVGPNGRYRPHPAGFADLLAAPRPERIVLRIAALADANLCDIPAVLSPLLEAWADAPENDEDPILPPLLHPAAVPADDPYLPLAQSRWPRSVLPALIWRDNPAALPPPPAFWDSLVLIYARPMPHSGPQHRPAFRALAPDNWRTMRQGVLSAATKEEFDHPTSQSLYAALRQCGTDAADALQMTRLYHLLPQRLAAGSDLPDLPQEDENAARVRALFPRPFAFGPALSGGK